MSELKYNFCVRDSTNGKNVNEKHNEIYDDSYRN